MSNKKKKPQPKPKNPRKNAIISISVALAVLLSGVLTWYLVTKEKPMIVQYNGMLTAKAQLAGTIGSNEVIIVHTVDDSASSYTLLECYIYQVPQGVKMKRMFRYYADELPEKWNLDPVGHATAKYLKGDLSSLYGMTVSHIK